MNGEHILDRSRAAIASHVFGGAGIYRRSNAGLKRERRYGEARVLDELKRLHLFVAPPCRCGCGGIRRGGSSGTDKIILTVWLAWTTLLVQRWYALSAGALKRPEWLTDSAVPGLVAVLIFLAGMYGLSAPATGSEDLPRREQLHLIIGWFITGAVGGGAIVYFFLTGGK